MRSISRFATAITALIAISITVVLVGRNGCRAAPFNGTRPDGGPLPRKFERLLPLHKQLGRPRPGEWLAEHEESGQGFRQYVRSGPIRPDKTRKTIYIQPLGQFDKSQRRIVRESAEFMELYFGLPVKVGDDMSLNVIPAEAQRTHPSWGMKQISSIYVLNQVLIPRLPKDAVASIAFTTSDLWPGDNWNFVFGQASLAYRVGVWSLYRFGDPNENEAAYRLCLRRALQTATHEMGHMFSMHHCIFYDCNMCGSNHLEEADSRPMALCPQCLAKLYYATGVEPKQRFEKLIAFCKKHGLEEEQAFYEKSLAAISEH